MKIKEWFNIVSYYRNKVKELELENKQLKERLNNLDKEFNERIINVLKEPQRASNKLTIVGSLALVSSLGLSYFGLYPIVGAITGTIAGTFLFGRFIYDPIKRVQLYNKLFKKPHLLVFLKMSKSLTTKVIPKEGGLIKIGTKMYYYNEGKLYNYHNPEEFIELDEESIFYIESVPVIFLDLENAKPLRFETDDPVKISPEELAGNILGWLDAEREKDSIMMRRKMNLLLFGVLIAVIVIGFLVWQNYSMLEQLVKQGASAAKQVATTTGVIQ